MLPLPIPFFVEIVFLLTTSITVHGLWWILRQSHHPFVRSKATLFTAGIIAWLGLQALLSLAGVYSSDTMHRPPTLVLFGIVPMLLLCIVIVGTRTGREAMMSIPLESVMLLHMVRIPVEFVLLWLFQAGAVPQIMTFEGRNLDIVAGLTAPLIVWLHRKYTLSSKILLAWNIGALCFLMNIVIHALLSAPTPLQRFGFEQPNIGILYFPFSWLPTFIVPVVLLCHIVAIWHLRKRLLEESSASVS
jgi:hypothetical protein